MTTSELERNKRQRYTLGRMAEQYYSSLRRNLLPNNIPLAQNSVILLSHSSLQIDVIISLKIVIYLNITMRVSLYLLSKAINCTLRTNWCHYSFYPAIIRIRHKVAKYAKQKDWREENVSSYRQAKWQWQRVREIEREISSAIKTLF